MFHNHEIEEQEEDVDENGFIIEDPPSEEHHRRRRRRRPLEIPPADEHEDDDEYLFNDGIWRLLAPDEMTQPKPKAKSKAKAKAKPKAKDEMPEVSIDRMNKIIAEAPSLSLYKVDPKVELKKRHYRIVGLSPNNFQMDIVFFGIYKYLLIIGTTNRYVWGYLIGSKELESIKQALYLFLNEPSMKKATDIKIDCDGEGSFVSLARNTRYLIDAGTQSIVSPDDTKRSDANVDPLVPKRLTRHASPDPPMRYPATGPPPPPPTRVRREGLRENPTPSTKNASTAYIPREVNIYIHAEQDTYHNRLTLMDRMIRTIRDYAYVISLALDKVVTENIRPARLISILDWYNRCPHCTLSRLVGFDVSPLDVITDHDLEAFIAKKLILHNVCQRNNKLQIGQFVSVLYVPDHVPRVKTRYRTEPFLYKVIGYAGGMYVIKNKKGEIRLAPGYHVKAE
jgi:hypothetical protein